MSKTTVVTIPPILDENGRPKPAASYTTGYSWCEETKQYEHDSIVTKLGNQYSRVIHPLTKKLGFAWLVEGPRTLVKIVNREHKYTVQSFTIPQTFASTEMVRKDFFNPLIHWKKTDNKHRVALKHVILSKPVWDALYVPNKPRATSYVRNEDSALNSFATIMAPYDYIEWETTYLSGGITLARKEIAKRRNAVAEDKNSIFPLVEIYAIWQNYVTNGSIFLGQYKMADPVLYYYNVVNTPADFEKLAL